MSFANLKKSSAGSLATLVEAAEKLSTKKTFEKDIRYWQVTRDKAGNGSAVIRFLPAPEGENLPFVRLWHHAFQGPGGWYIENSRTTIDDMNDPLYIYNGQLYNSGIESQKELAKKAKRKQSFISNIYVVKDPGNPENEGKVFLFKYGKKIFDKLNDAAMGDPEDDEVVKFDPFNMWTGANFKLKVGMVEGYPNYDKSTFSVPAPLATSDAELEKIYKKLYSLTTEVAPDKFKSNEELKARMLTVFKIGDVSKVLKTKEKEVDEELIPSQASEASDDLSFFKQLAEEE